MGVMVAQDIVDRGDHAIGIAKHVMIPKSNGMVPFGSHHRGPSCIVRPFMLAAIDLDHELRAVAGKVGDEVAERYLPPEMRIGEMLAQQPPE